MRSLIIGLWGRVKYNHGLRGVAAKCAACVGGFIRVGLKSAVIRIIYNHGLRSVADKCSAWVGGFIRVGLKSAVIKRTPLALAFAVVVDIAAQADAQVPFADSNLKVARTRRFFLASAPESF